MHPLPLDNHTLSLCITKVHPGSTTVKTVYTNERHNHIWQVFVAIGCAYYPPLLGLRL